MHEHILTMLQPAKEIPSVRLPDGAITGNGDVTVILGGSADIIRIHINKADFWKSDGDADKNPTGGIAPLGMVEIRLPQLAYAAYKAEQNLDKAYIKLSLTEKSCSAELKITVCAEDNTILLELDRTHPVVSASAALVCLEGSEAAVSCDWYDDVQYTIRGFDSPACRFPTYGICALRRISRVVSAGREKIVWAIGVCTNHDTAAYKNQAIEKVRVLDEDGCKKLLAAHEKWWTRFWAKSSVELPDKELELHWYAGLYAVACCMRNKKFPPGIWGGYATADGMEWFGDYHLNYNYQAPFYALCSANHTELLECYTAPLKDFLPTAQRFARDYLGIRGAYYPVGIGPLGMETGCRASTKEHGHLFLGQKSNGAYAAVIPMMHWYATRDTDFAQREYYDFLFSVAEFWENYLVWEDGIYQIYNDGLLEVAWWSGPDYMPEGHDDKNPTISRGMVRMLMKLMIDLATELERDTEKIPKWKHILEHLPTPDMYENNGEMLLRSKEGSEEIIEVAMEYVYPAGQVGKYTTPELFEAAKNTHRRLAIWDSHNRFCSYYPMAARFEYPPEEIISHIHDVIDNRALPNGMIFYYGGGMENSSAIPSVINEMLLQSYEGIIRLFPVWDKKQNVRFHGLRANGAFVIDASLENGRISADILSEQGMPLVVEIPYGGGTLVREDGKQISAAEGTLTVNTCKGERIKLFSAETNIS